MESRERRACYPKRGHEKWSGVRGVQIKIRVQRRDNKDKLFGSEDITRHISDKVNIQKCL